MTYEDFKEAVWKDNQNHKIKELAELFLAAMIDWTDTPSVEVFIEELKEFCGEPITIENLKNKPFSLEKKHDAWRFEAGASIVQMLELSIQFDGEDDFDKVVERILGYYRK